MKKHYIDCDCQDFDHLLRIAYFDDKDIHNELYIEVHLRQKSFLKRLWLGLKYVFGFRSSFGDFDEFVMTRKKVLEIKKVLEDFIKTTDE